MIKHGHKVGNKESPTYISWMCMLRRCEDPSINDYQRYGGMGIKVCARWHDFRNFLEDMGERPVNHVIDRKYRSQNYEPANCRWVTPKESANNRGNNRYVICNGNKVSVAIGALLIGVKYGTLFAKMRLANWPPIDITSLSFRRR